MNKTRLRKYANLIARCGVNIQKGQEVIISAELDQPEFVKMLVDECYKAGASKVSVDWSYQPLTKLNVRHCSAKVLGSLDKWQLEKWEHQAEVLPCKIYLMSEDPDGLAGVNQKKYATAMASRSKLIKPIRNKMENKYQWCIAAVPGKGWAKKVFPGERTSVAIEKLWEAILSTSRVDEDPIEAWNKHNADLKSRCDYLNSLGIKELKYKASNGTDFRVGLLPDATFMAGGEETLGRGVYFNPNIPTEEVFTSPRKGDADGVVYSSKPLSYGGQLIDNFMFRFEKGKIVEVKAKQNEKLLEELVSMDEGASFLGEVALVPHSSPIQESGILFYNTLFDENAACHLAFGRGFTNVIVDYDKFTEEELHAKGINDSIVHEDFMIGTSDMSITAVCSDGREVAIFKGGEWAF
ncbi:MAG: aminopeptidase [Ruminococcaceae bacterium]|nr:aminopeptidase [Oscillospiraceae bacterium]